MNTRTSGAEAFKTTPSRSIAEHASSGASCVGTEGAPKSDET
jgi:hypothetical protein